MMNLYLTIAILLANIISIGIVYQFVKKMPKKQILIFIAISVGIMYVLVSAIYWISGIGIEENVHEVSKNFVLYLFVPVNVILFIPYLGFQYMKLRENKIDPEGFFKKIIFLIILLLIVFTAEYFYFRNIQTNITNINVMQNTTKNNEAKEQEIFNNISNEELTTRNNGNEIVNEVIKENKSNTVQVNEENNNVVQNEIYREDNSNTVQINKENNKNEI